MKWALVGALTLALTPTLTLAGSCFFFDQRDPTPQPSLSQCSWYSSAACCTAIEARLVMDTMPPLPQNSSLGCTGALEMLACYFCSPAQHKWMAPESGAVTVCRGFCNRIYAECEDVLVDGRPFAKMWSSGNDFCHAHGFQIETQEAEGHCYNTSPPIRTGTALLVVVIWLSMLCLLYTSDAADEEDSVDLGGRRIIKKKKHNNYPPLVRDKQRSSIRLHWMRY
eukprot:TRINITY_DN18703_c0_g1_i1.p1 TRINITY_DN18703_c0_g1~~TRINITY_DN18703_c0_g1_i1.p1  ORF type:complete len:224 (-),score=21.96 TRINITY_DN18703_c0_g1_i1:38-709(-)